MTILKEVAAEELRLKGLGIEFHSFSRIFKSKNEALEAVSTEDFVPVQGDVQLVFVVGYGAMMYSFELEDFVLVAELQTAGNQASRYIHLDGVNNYIDFNEPASAADLSVLDFTKSWSVGCTLVGVQGGAGQHFMTLFSRSGVHITLNAIDTSTNWGLYVTSDNSLYSTNKRATANTWHRPEDFSRLLFTYDATTKRLKYYIGDQATGTYAMRSNMLISDTMIANQNIAGPLCIGNSWTGEGGASWSGKHWHGGVNNLIVSDICFNGPHLDEYFQVGEAFKSMELYQDLTAYCKLGEDTYPSVTDELNFLQGGELKNGTESDFRDVPTE